MKKIPVTYSFLLILILQTGKLSAQAAFTFAPSTGCAPLTVQFTDQSTGAIAWNWNFGNATTSVLQNPFTIYTNAGTYTITLTIFTMNGTTYTASHTLQVDTVPLTPDTIFCSPVCYGAGSVVGFYIDSVAGATSYNWTVPAGSAILGGQGSDSLMVLLGTLSGNISVSASNACGASASQILHISGSGTIPDTSVNVNGSTLTSNAIQPTAYLWVSCPGMLTISGATNQSYIASQTGSYAVILNNSGCVDTSSCHNVIVSGVPDYDKSVSEIVLSPNPATTSFTITGNFNDDDATVIISDVTGRVLMNKKMQANKNRIDVTLTGDEEGIYFVSLENNKGQYATSKIALVKK